MAKKGGGKRKGSGQDRSQVRNPKTGLWTKRDSSSGQFKSVKKSGGAYRGVRRER